MLSTDDARFVCREHARLREDEPSDLDPPGSGRSGVGEGDSVGGRSEWSIRQGGCPGPQYSTVLISGRLRRPLLTLIKSSALNSSPLHAGSFSGLAKAVKRVGRSDRTESHDEGRSLLSADDAGSLHESGGASQKAPAELAPHDAFPAVPSSDSREQARVQGGHPALQDGHPSSNGGSSPAGPANLQRLSFVKNPGLTNIQTPFSSVQALADHPWQPQERPHPLESIAGEPSPAVAALIALACRLSCILRSCVTLDASQEDASCIP